MGNMAAYMARRKFVVNEGVEGQDLAAKEVFSSLGLSKSDVDLLFTAFWDIDADGSGLIKPTELFSYFEVEGTRFEYGVFSLFDEDHSGMINFMEFVCTLWNLLTLPDCDYGSLAFLIKDPSATGTITYSDIRELLEMMHGKKIDRDPSLHNVYNKLRRELGNAFTIQDFNRWTAAHPYVVSPIMMLQLHIRLQIIGEPFWMKLTLLRKEHPEQGKLDYVKQLQNDVVGRNDLFRQRLLAEAEERRRLSRLARGHKADAQGNIERKQSVLLTFFNLKPAKRNADWNKKHRKSLARVVVTDADEGNENGAASVPQTTAPAAAPTSVPAHPKIEVTAAAKDRRRRSSFALGKPNLVREREGGAKDRSRTRESVYRKQRQTVAAGKVKRKPGSAPASTSAAADTLTNEEDESNADYTEGGGEVWTNH